MSDEEKKIIVDQIKKQFPTAGEQRIESLLNLILLEIKSYNTCDNVIDWQELSDLISEVLYQAMKNESEKAITAVKRGDTSISYANTSQAVRQLLDGYAAMINRLIGCDNGVSFF